MAMYEIWVADANGQNTFICTDYLEAEWTRTQNEIGTLNLRFPYRYDPTRFARDTRIAIYGSIGGAPSALDGPTIYFVRQRGIALSESGEYVRTIRAFDANYLLSGRFVDYVAGSSQASKSAAADDMLKAIVRENLGSSAGSATGRNLSAYLTVEADASSGVAIEKSFAWRNVLTVLQEIARTSTEQGTWLGFDVTATSLTDPLTFRTWVGQRGADRRYAGTNPLLIAPEFGNLSPVSLDEDWSEEVTAITCGGQGEGAARTIVRTEDTTRITASPFGRRESFEDARNSGTLAAVTDEAAAALRAGQSRISFSGTVHETSTVLFGHDYGYGDLITISFDHQLIDCRVIGYRRQIAGGAVRTEALLRSL